MDPKITPAVNALIQGISEFLGQPDLQHDKMIHWQRGEFEVAIQRDTGPHVWLSTMWRPPGQPFRDLAGRLETYEKGKPRHSGLKMTKWLGPEHRARRISNIGDVVPTVVRCIRACAEDAGVIAPLEIHVIASNETVRDRAAESMQP